MLVLDFSHRKLSGHVFSACTSQGTKWFGFISPLFQIQRPTQFWAQRASLISAWSVRALRISSSTTHFSTSRWTRESVLLTSSTLALVSRRGMRSLMLALRSSSLPKSSKRVLVKEACCSTSLKEALDSRSLARVSSSRLRGSSSEKFTF